MTRRDPLRNTRLRSGWTPAEPPRRPVLFVNPRSGGGKAARAAVAEHARDRGVEAIVVAADASLEALVAESVAGGADAIGVAGGDGSLAVGAAAALTHGIPFVCVPAGTRNHFALDVGVDGRDVVGALDAFTDGVERRIDVAEVNGRLFLNNVLGEDPAIKMLGLGLATAIFVDATIVRVVLVPATMKLMGDANWWIPAWLDRLLPTIDIDNEAHLPEPELEPADELVLA